MSCWTQYLNISTYKHMYFTHISLGFLPCSHTHTDIVERECTSVTPDPLDCFASVNFFLLEGLCCDTPGICYVYLGCVGTWSHCISVVCCLFTKCYGHSLQHSYQRQLIKVICIINYYIMQTWPLVPRCIVRSLPCILPQSVEWNKTHCGMS